MWIECQQRGWIRRDLDARHNLMWLWNAIKPAILHQGIVSANDDLVRVVEKSFNLVNQIDRSSEHSRYPQTLSGELHGIDFDLKELIRAMDYVDTLFFGVSAMLDMHDDHVLEMARAAF